MADGAIYNQIKEAVQKDIEAQVEHLKGLIDDTSESKERYIIMSEGAQTVLNVLNRDAICATGTTAWLKNLDYDQLVFAKERCTELINKKDDEEKIKIWNTKSDLIVDYEENGYYLTYEEAVAGLLKIIEDNSKENANKRNSLGIYPMMVRESELSDYITATE